MILFFMILFPSGFPEWTGRDSQNHEVQNHGEAVNGVGQQQSPSALNTIAETALGLTIIISIDEYTPCLTVGRDSHARNMTWVFASSC